VIRRYPTTIVLLLGVVLGCGGKDNPTKPPGNPPPGGSNGKIAFVSRRDATAGVNDDDLYVMNPDGSNIRRLTNLLADLGEASVSPDGSRIAFTNHSAGEIDVVRSDGTGLAGITQGGGANWSPDGSQMAITRNGGIFVVDADGTDAHQVTTDGGQDAAWSPDGSRIAYYRETDYHLCLINPDGTGFATVGDSLVCSGRPDWKPDGSLLVFRGTPGPNSGAPGFYTVRPDGAGLSLVLGISTPFAAERPSWSPDGSRIAFAKYISGSYDVFVVKADGIGLTNISNAGGVDSGPDWGP
jgi:TolB protein